MRTVEEYKAVKWLHAAAETYTLETACNRFQKILTEEGYTDARPVKPRRLRKAAVAFLQSEDTFLALKERASL